MVDYKCLEPSCAKVYRQEASLIAHITRHLNDGNYLPVLEIPHRRRAKSKTPATPVPEKKTVSQATKAKRHEAKLASARQEWTERRKQVKKMKKVLKTFKKIASGQIGTPSGQSEVVDLRTPSMSPSVQEVHEMVNAPSNIEPHTQRMLSSPQSITHDTPHTQISEAAVNSLHHLAVSLSTPPATPRVGVVSSISSKCTTPRQTTPGASSAADRAMSESAIIAMHHLSSIVSPPTPQTWPMSFALSPDSSSHSSRQSTPQIVTLDNHISERDIIVMHHRSVSQTPTPKNTGVVIVPATPSSTGNSPSRLGPSWKTETPALSIAGDLDEEDEQEEDVDELESDSGTPTPTSRSTDWAFAGGIDPKQWDEILTHSPVPQLSMDDLAIEDDFSDHEYDAEWEAAPTEMDVDSDDNDVNEECGYRVLRGVSALESVNSAQWGEHSPHGDTDKAPSQVSTRPSFDNLSPRRPTAREATSSTGRVSAEIGSPLSIGSQSTPSFSRPSKLEDMLSHFHCPHQSLGGFANVIQVDNEDSNRDQVILALLRAGRVDLAASLLRGETDDAGSRSGNGIDV